MPLQSRGAHRSFSKLAFSDQGHFGKKASHGNAGVWKAWKAMKPAFHPSHTPWKSLRGFPHYHGYGDDYHESEDRQSPPKTRNQSHSHRKGLVNHVPGLKRKGCPGTLIPQDTPPISCGNLPMIPACLDLFLRACGVWTGSRCRQARFIFPPW
jgi:hypothetical protein